MKILVYRHPFAGERPEEFEADSLGEWLLAHYGDTPKVGVQVFTGEPSGETEITGDLQAIMAAAEPAYTVLESPGAPAIPYIIQLVISLALSYMMRPSNLKPLDSRSQESPNNQLSGRQNQIRTMQRVEDIYGTVRSIPSLMMPTYNKYIQHRKVEYGYYCVGRGYHTISDVRDGDTPLSEITGASAAIYAPFTSPNSGSPQDLIGDAIIDPILSVSRSSSADGIILKPINQLQLPASSSYGFYGPGDAGEIGVITQDVIYQPLIYGREPNFSAVAEVSQTLSVTMTPVEVTRSSEDAIFSATAATDTYACNIPGFFNGFQPGSIVTVAGFTVPTNNGDKTIVAVTSNPATLQVAEPLDDDGGGGIGFTFTCEIDYSGTRTIASVENGYVTLTGSPVFPPSALAGSIAVAAIEVDNGLSDWTDWFTLPDTDRTEVWTNVLAQGGMYKDDGSKSATTVEYEVQIEQLTSLLVPTGVVETVTGSITGSTGNERAETLERVTAWTGPARVRARRTTPFDYDFEGLVVDEIALVDLYSVVPVSAVTYPHFGNKTTIHTVTKANAESTSVRQRQLNCLASRLLPIYDGSTFTGSLDADGQLVSGTLGPTSRIVEIIAAVTIDPKIGNRDITDLDLAQIWSVQGELAAWHDEVGKFNYTFDSDVLSFEETLAAIANAAFCTAYRQNGVIRLSLDRPQTTSTALFTHRNKKPASESITRQFASDSDFDGIEFLYLDPDTEAQETIRLPLDGSYTKLKKVEISGIRSYEQAWLRANRELYRLLNQRLTIETVATTDARALLPNGRVDIVDNTRIKSYDGEVVGQDGLTLTLSRDVEFIPATSHSIVLMKRDGSLQSIACTAGASANQVVLAGAPAEAIVTTATAEDGIRTIFSFAADSARAAQAWLVQEVGISDGKYVRVRAVNYSADYYAADEEAIPAKEGVIY